MAGSKGERQSQIISEQLYFYVATVLRVMIRIRTLKVFKTRLQSSTHTYLTAQITI